MLIIDCHNLAIREAYTKVGLSYGGRTTGVIFGFLQQVTRLTALYPGEVCFCWDSPRDLSFRRRFWPGYKANRDGKEVPEAVREAMPQMVLLRDELLPRLGFPNQFIQEGYEADDLIGALCLGQSPAPVKVVVSSDNDLFQLLGPRTVIHNLGKGRAYGWRDFEREYGILPAQWPEIKAMAGDSSDGIDGVPGVGIKTAIKHFYGRAGVKVSQRIEAHAEVIGRNRRLVTLPWPGCDPGPVRESSLDQAEFRHVCIEFGIGSLA